MASTRLRCSTPFYRLAAPFAGAKFAFYPLIPGPQLLRTIPQGGCFHLINLNTQRPPAHLSSRCPALWVPFVSGSPLCKKWPDSAGVSVTRQAPVMYGPDAPDAGWSSRPNAGRRYNRRLEGVPGRRGVPVGLTRAVGHFPSLVRLRVARAGGGVHRVAVCGLRWSRSTEQNRAAYFQAVYFQTSGVHASKQRTVDVGLVQDS